MEEEQSKDEPVAKASPSDTFCNTMSSMICQKDVEIIHSIQMNAFSKMDKTNERFDKFNRLSFERYNRLHNHFQNHTRMLVDMKKDLDIVFRRIRNLKTKLSNQYGDAFMVTTKNIQKIEELEAQAETTYTEEKPQSEPQETNTTYTQNTLATHEQDSLNAQSSSLGAEETATNITAEEIETRKSKDGRVSTQSKTAYESKLVPQLSTSDESYGVQDTDSDDDNDGGDDGKDNDGDNSNTGINTLHGNDDGDVNNGDVVDDNFNDNGGDDGKDNDNNSNIDTIDEDDNDDDHGNEDVNDDDKDINNARRHQDNSATSNLKQQSSHETSSKTTCSKELNKSNESPTQDAVSATHCEYSSSDESLESDSDVEIAGDTQNNDNESQRTCTEDIQPQKNINS